MSGPKFTLFPLSRPPVVAYLFRLVSKLVSPAAVRAPAAPARLGYCAFLIVNGFICFLLAHKVNVVVSTGVDDRKEGSLRFKSSGSTEN